MADQPNIRDIPQFKKMREEMRALRTIRRLVRVTSPLLRLLRIDVEALQAEFGKFPELEHEFNQLSEFPDRFNETFAPVGFILFGFLNLEIAKEALSIADKDLGDAEQFLVDHFSVENVQTYLGMMYGIRAFRPRMTLAEKALVDYEAGRYHACVPVVLALTDGLVNSLNPKQLGISADASDLSAWNSMTAHEKGLNALKNILFKARKTTRTDEISLPYRHGILHGMDLGYDNKTVAAKTWALLFAVRDWAEKAERKELGEVPAEPRPSLREILSKFRSSQDTKARLENWSRRSIVVGTDIPATGDPNDYYENTPERKVVEFLQFWKKKNYGGMGACVLAFLQAPDIAKRLRETYQDYSLIGFEITGVNDLAAAVSEVAVIVEFQTGDERTVNSVSFRLVINESPTGEVMMRDMPNATWGIANYGHAIIRSESQS